MKLYAWGANSHGQLGLGYSSEECRVPTLAANLPTDLESNLGKVKSIVGGGGHTLILTQDGAVYSCGWNTKGQLGYPTEKAEQKDFRRIEKLADLKISKVACGWDHSLALTCDGRVFSWGSNAFSQLGIPKTKVPSHTVDPMAVDIPTPVISIAAGLRHSAAADETGHVHVWGTGRHGQLGLTFDGQPLTETDKPQTIAWDEEAVKVCCGQYHTAVQCRNGHVYTFGQNKFGQLILPVQKSSSHTPCLVTEMSWIGKGKLMEVFAGWTHGVAHTESGHVFTWGRGDYGQLGRTVNQSRSNSETDPKPSQVKLPSNVVSVAVGSEHCMALLDTGAVAIWGWNEHGTCGTKDLNNILAPMILPVSLKEAAVCIGCGAGTSFMLVDETLPRPKQDRSLLSKVANVVLGAASGGSVTGVPLINDNGGKYSAVPGTTDSAQTAWDQGDGEAVRRDSDGETLLKSGKKKSKAFRLGAANTKDGECRIN